MSFFMSNSLLIKIVYWLPRVLSVAFVLFLSLFALDVFDYYRGWEVVAALFMHLLPSFVLLAVIAVAWRFELVGTVVFIFAAFGYIWLVGFDRHWTWYAFISGPAFLLGMLYFISWAAKKKYIK